MRLFLDRQDIQNLNKVSEKEALHIMREIRETYKLPKKRYISVRAYCDYFRVSCEDVYHVLGYKQTG
ncbi:hypothetical protein [uncultured Winogradskyella sp.]|uniref:hypothetical protein n=1 Tax=uncultured Winogradskyella sp. TaxID=395353 RepID=UPI00351475E3